MGAGLCKLERRRVVLPNGQILRQPARDSRKFANNMSRRPTKVNKAHKHCYGLLKSLNKTNQDTIKYIATHAAFTWAISLFSINFKPQVE